jgi:hypothetical protein
MRTHVSTVNIATTDL